MTLKKKLSICSVGILVLAFAFIVTRQVVERIGYPQKPIVIGSLSKENIKSLSIHYYNDINALNTEVTSPTYINKIIDLINSLGKGEQKDSAILTGATTISVKIIYKNINTSILLVFYTLGTKESPEYYMSYNINNNEQVSLLVDKNIRDELLTYFNKYQK